MRFIKKTSYSMILILTIGYLKTSNKEQNLALPIVPKNYLEQFKQFDFSYNPLSVSDLNRNGIPDLLGTISTESIPYEKNVSEIGLTDVSRDIRFGIFQDICRLNFYAAK